MENPPTSLPSEAVAYARQFFDGARRGEIELFKAPLEAGLPSNLTNDKGDTLLMLACYHGHSELAELLLMHGADPNKLNDRGQSCLAGAVFKKEDLVIKTLLANGADPRAGTPSGIDTVKLFKQDETWMKLFDEAVTKLDEKKVLE